MGEALPIASAAHARTKATVRLSETVLVDEYGNSVYRFCRSITSAKEDADDLFQDTFLKAFSQMSKVRKADNPQSFLLSTAAYLWKSKRRKYARRNRLAPQTVLDESTDNGNATASTEDDFMLREEQVFVRRLVEALPEKLKIPTVLYYTNEMSVADIASALKLPEGTIKSRLHRARKIIEKGLASEYGY
jgi:RNA polymerase sigma-70 factor (ECF subfamily)